MGGDISLVVLKGPDAGRYLKVPKEGGTIGRDPEVEISLADPAVSRRHAILERSGQAYAVRDLDSRYGTYVEGARTTCRDLCDGDNIQISGDTVIRVLYQDPRRLEALNPSSEAEVRDALTGLANRRSFFERLEQEYAFARRHDTPLTILAIDVDQEIGDGILRAVGRVLQGSLRVEDDVARFGGDEFMVIARGYNSEEGPQIGERLCGGMRGRSFAASPREPQGEPSRDRNLTLSIGVATYERGDPDTMMNLIARAEAALHAAKSGGKDRVETWRPEIACLSTATE